MHVWQARFYDFNVWSERKRIEKLRYMHRNPVKRGLVSSPEEWRWSSFRFYMFGEVGLVQVNETDLMKMRVRAPAVGASPSPAPCKKRKERGPPVRGLQGWATRLLSNQSFPRSLRKGLGF